MMHYIFDVDGTLTPSRGRIDREFADWFEHFATHNAVYLVTGSDKDKTIEQLGRRIWNLAVTCYQCSGNDVWKQDVNIRSGILNLPDKLQFDLLAELHDSGFRPKTGRHIEKRPGLVNFSILGRKASLEDRYNYRGWDEHKNERESICVRLRPKWPGFNFQIAGETGIDITAQGSTKAQILKDFDSTDTIYFFGDNCQLGGNDHEIALAVHDRENKSTVFEVVDWEDTWNKLKELSE